MLTSSSLLTLPLPLFIFLLVIIDANFDDAMSFIAAMIHTAHIGASRNEHRISL